MEAPPTGGGFAAGAAVHRDPLSPSAFVGVEQISFDNFAFIAPMNGRDMRVAGFNTAAAAAEGYDELMRVQKCPFVNTPKLPGEMRAVPVRRAGDGEPISQQPEAQKKPVSPPVDAPAAGAPAEPRRFKGVAQKGRYTFVATVSLGDGVHQRLGSFGSAEAAARACDEKMREHKRLVVNFPQLPGEVQAVYGEQEQVTLARHKQDPNRVVIPVRRIFGPRPAATAPSATLLSPPPPAAAAAAAAVVAAPLPPPSLAPPPQPPPPARVEDTRQYKGVKQSSKYRFVAQYGKMKEQLGYFNSAKEAADAYDAHVRKTSGSVAPVVNTPLHAGEIQAVPGEHDSVSRQRAADGAARDEAQPLRASRRAAGLPAPADALALTPKKRMPSDEPPEDAGAGGYATDDDVADAAPAEPEPKRMPAPEVPAAPLPPAPQQALALAPVAPAPAAAIVAVAGGDDDDLVAFLRGISPPLVDIDRVAAAAADSGVQMSQLRDAVRSPPAEGASRVNLAADVLGIRRGADKLILLKALWQLM
jgi:hypothetical protein